MKSLVCESCGGIDFLQGKGFYVCSACGTKIVAEGNESKTENLLKAARQARAVGNWELAGSTYDRILAEDPENWEAVFFSSACRAYKCVIGHIALAAQQTTAAAVSALMLVKSNVKNADEQKAAVGLISTHCIALGKMMYNAALKHYKEINSEELRRKYKGEAADRILSSINIMKSCGETIDSLFDDPDISVCAVPVLKEAFLLIDEVEKSVYKITTINTETVNRIRDIIAKTDKAFLEDFDIKRRKENVADMKSKKIVIIVWLVLAAVCLIWGLNAYDEIFQTILYMIAAVNCLFSVISFFEYKKAKKKISAEDSKTKSE